MRTVLLTTLLFILTFGIISAQETKSSATLFSKNPEQLYLGAVLSKKSINTEKHEFKDIKTKEKISLLSTTFKYEFPEILPTKENMYQVIAEELKAKGAPTSSGIASYSFYPIRNLEDLYANFGQKMDLGKWFGLDINNKMPVSNILIAYEIPLFDLYLDIAETGMMNYREELAKLKDDDLIYVMSITWGRKALIFVQSDFDENSLKVALNRYLNDEGLTEEQKVILETATFSYNIFEDIPLELENPNPIKTVLNYLSGPITADNYGAIIHFMADEIDGSTYNNNF
ncbi:hypothetical protein [Sphingobacterium mizutaii]|uniref:hypothetical protein n=1 Tax=Sphingobacterium mizutaii TaxID=1010 RepID=UPI00289ADEEA|nr:hypothetical protein [Sphingobacterium mizutaii]